MIITLVGENSFAVHEAEHALVARFVAKFGEHGVERLDGEEFDPTRLSELLQGVSLFTPQRLVILHRAASNKLLWDALADWAERVPAETTLIISEPTPDKRTRTYKLLKGLKNYQEFNVPSDQQLVQWLSKQAKALGGGLGIGEANYLLERAGRDQWRLHHELNKLVAYQPGITRQTIDELVEPSPEGTAFELLDAALAGQAKRLDQLISNLKTEEDPYKLFGLLTSQAYGLAVVGAAGRRSPDEIAKDAGLHPFVVRKLSGAAERLGTSGIRRVAEIVAKTDYQLKSTSADPWQLLTSCLHKIASFSG